MGWALCLSSWAVAWAQPGTSPEFRQMLASHPRWFGWLLEAPDAYRVQVLVSQVHRDAQGNVAQVDHFSYRLDTFQYFYPASVVKLPTAVVALEKLNQLRQQGVLGLDHDAQLCFLEGPHCSPGIRIDTHVCYGYPTLGMYVAKAMLVSDNEAFDRLYDFVGQGPLNQTLHQKGYRSARIIQRFGHRCDPEANRYNNAYAVLLGRDTLWGEPLRYNAQAVRSPMTDERIGQFNYVNGRNVPGPKDFGGNNAISLWDLHRILQAVFTPEAVPESARFELRPEDRQLLRHYMGALADEVPEIPYLSPWWHCCRVKYLYLGGEDERPPSGMRIHNKVGQSYGFLVDAAYITDTNSRTEYYLSAVVYVNRDGVVGNGKYEYYTVGLPFLRHLGRAVHAWVVRRQAIWDLEHECETGF
jgi:hypothetical protein